MAPPRGSSGPFIIIEMATSSRATCPHCQLKIIASTIRVKKQRNLWHLNCFFSAPFNPKLRILGVEALEPYPKQIVEAVLNNAKNGIKPPLETLGGPIPSDKLNDQPNQLEQNVAREAQQQARVKAAAQPQNQQQPVSQPMWQQGLQHQPNTQQQGLRQHQNTQQQMQLLHATSQQMHAAQQMMHATSQPQQQLQQLVPTSQAQQLQYLSNTGQPQQKQLQQTIQQLQQAPHLPQQQFVFEQQRRLIQQQLEQTRKALEGVSNTDQTMQQAKGNTGEPPSLHRSFRIPPTPEIRFIVTVNQNTLRTYEVKGSSCRIIDQVYEDDIAATAAAMDIAMFKLKTGWEETFNNHNEVLYLRSTTTEPLDDNEYRLQCSRVYHNPLLDELQRYRRVLTSFIDCYTCGFVERAVVKHNHGSRVTLNVAIARANKLARYLSFTELPNVPDTHRLTFNPFLLHVDREKWAEQGIVSEEDIFNHALGVEQSWRFVIKPSYGKDQIDFLQRYQKYAPENAIERAQKCIESNFPGIFPLQLMEASTMAPPKIEPTGLIFVEKDAHSYVGVAAINIFSDVLE